MKTQEKNTVYQNIRTPKHQSYAFLKKSDLYKLN